MKTTYSPSDAGCYGDGAFGHQHTREACAAVLIDAQPLADEPARVDALTESLSGDMPDDAGDEIEACDVLNTVFDVDGHWWGWYDGDFGLWPDVIDG